MSVPDTTKLYLKWLKWLSFMLWVFYHNKKGKEERLRTQSSSPGILPSLPWWGSSLGCGGGHQVRPGGRRSRAEAPVSHSPTDHSIPATSQALLPMRPPSSPHQEDMLPGLLPPGTHILCHKMKSCPPALPGCCEGLPSTPAFLLGRLPSCLQSHFFSLLLPQGDEGQSPQVLKGNVSVVRDFEEASMLSPLLLLPLHPHLSLVAEVYGGLKMGVWYVHGASAVPG